VYSLISESLRALHNKTHIYFTILQTRVIVGIVISYCQNRIFVEFKARQDWRFVLITALWSRGLYRT